MTITQILIENLIPNTYLRSKPNSKTPKPNTQEFAIYAELFAALNQLCLILTIQVLIIHYITSIGGFVTAASKYLSGLN